MSLMLLFLKIIDLFFSSRYTYDVIQKLGISEQSNESFDDDKIKEINDIFVNYIFICRYKF